MVSACGTSRARRERTDRDPRQQEADDRRQARADRDQGEDERRGEPDRDGANEIRLVDQASAPPNGGSRRAKRRIISARAARMRA
jgi:hypothetical protein